MATKASRYLLNRAVACPAGVCVLCGPGWAPDGAWVPGTGQRLCTDHNEIEQTQAMAALILAGQVEARRV